MAAIEVLDLVLSVRFWALGPRYDNKGDYTDEHDEHGALNADRI